MQTETQTCAQVTDGICTVWEFERPIDGYNTVYVSLALIVIFWLVCKTIVSVVKSLV